MLNLILMSTLFVELFLGTNGMPRHHVRPISQITNRRMITSETILKYNDKYEQPQDSGIEDEVKFYLFTRMNQDTYQELIFNNETSVKDSYINFDYPTTFVTHGYLDSVTSDAIQQVKNALLTREQHNVIAIDWSSLADTVIYTNAAGDVAEVGQYVSQFIQFLVKTGQTVDKLHLIGHSLGAHVVGLAGQNFTQTTQVKIPRITGLDPAKPDFTGVDATQRLDASDAVFVDCIHTCSGELGMGKPVCSVDFYPNGDSGYQPGCPWWDIAGICSHGRSHEYYAESVQLTHRFPAKQCQTVPLNNNADDCAASNALMGDPATPQYLGLYLVTTNDQYPFSQDIVNSTSTLS